MAECSNREKIKDADYQKIRFYIEAAMAVAMSIMFVLCFGILRVPASIPVFFLSYRKSPKIAMISGIIIGYLMILIRPVLIHPIILIEAPLEYMCIALAGYFPMGDKKFNKNWKQWFYDNRGVITGTVLRFLITLAGSYIIYSFYFKSSGKLIWLIALMDEGPIFIPYLIFSMALIPYLVRYKYEIHELK